MPSLSPWIVLIGRGRRSKRPPVGPTVPGASSDSPRLRQSRPVRRVDDRAPTRLDVLVARPREVVVAGIARTDSACAGPGNTPSLGIQAPSDVDSRRQPAADAIATELAAPARCVVAFGAAHGPQPSVPRWIRTEGRGLAQRAIRIHQTKLPRADRPTPVEADTGPAVATPAPRPPASQRFRALGGFRAGAEGASRRARSLPDSTPI